jgi:hypothetical protein
MKNDILKTNLLIRNVFLFVLVEPFFQLFFLVPALLTGMSPSGLRGTQGFGNASYIRQETASRSGELFADIRFQPPKPSKYHAGVFLLNKNRPKIPASFLHKIDKN